MMKRLSLAGNQSDKKPLFSLNSNTDGQKGKRNKANPACIRSSTDSTKESFFSKLKKPPIAASTPETTPTTISEVDLIMADLRCGDFALLPIHMNPSEPFLLDDYKDPSFEIDRTTGEPRSVASLYESGDGISHSNSANNPQKSNGRHFKAFRMSKNRTAQPHTATSTFWASLGRLDGRRAGTDAATSVDPVEVLDRADRSEATTNPETATTSDFQTIALSDSKMTTPLHEACRLGNAELTRLMLEHPFAEPNFKNGHRRTSLHMAAGGWTEREERLWRTRQHKLETKLNHKKKQQGESLQPVCAHNANAGISAPVPIKIVTHYSSADGDNNMSAVGAKKAARAMGRFLHTTFSSTPCKDNVAAKGSLMNTPSAEPQGYLRWDEDAWNKLKTERMDCLLAILSWCHPDDGTNSAGDGASVNAVDAQGRTALHYAAELGRYDVCVAVLSSFGAMLTVVDDSARTPCELAAEQNHPELAAQLEARALLYSDPYGMDDELLAAVVAEQQMPDDADIDVVEGENAAVVKARMCLSAPFSWFRTLDKDTVDKERTKRLANCCIAMMAFVKNKEEENELRRVMYGMKDDVMDDFSDYNSSESGLKEGDGGKKPAATDVTKAGNRECPERQKGGETKAEKASGAVGAEVLRGSNAMEERQIAGHGTGEESSETKDPDGAAILNSTYVEFVQVGHGSGSGTLDGQAQDGPPGQEKTPSAETKPAARYKSEELTEHDFSALKSIQNAHLAHYLSRHGWIVDKAMAAFADDPKRALEEVDVPLQAVLHAKQRPITKLNQDSIGSSMCLICFGEFDIVDSENWTNLVNCSHAFCNSCLGDYLVDCAKSKSTGLSVPCPHHECFVPMAQPEIESLSPGTGTYSLLKNTENDNFVARALDLRFCPHPGCDGIVKVLITENMKKWLYQLRHFSCVGAVCTAMHEKGKMDFPNQDKLPITYEGMIDPSVMDARWKSAPRNAHRFCFGCGERKYHFPVSCEVLEEWNKKIMDEIEQLKEDGDGPESDADYGDIAQRLWMRANTRPCPKVSAPVFTT